MIVFDLDNTLLNTKALTKSLINHFLATGIDEQILKTAWDDYSAENQRVFDLKKFLNYLKEGYQIDLVNNQHIHNYVSSSFAQYLNLGALELLQYLNQLNLEALLLTKGVADYQNLKIDNLGIRKFFKDIHICLSKKDYIHLYKSRAYFINDNWDEIQELRNLRPDINYVLYVRKDYHDFYDINDIDVQKILNLGEFIDLYTSMDGV